MAELKPKIMVVDDVPEIGEMLTRFLTKKNYEVTSFTSAKEALEHLKTNEVNPVRKSTDNGDNNISDSNRNTAKLSNGVNLLLTDMLISISEMTGIELIKATKEFNPNLPILVMTSYPGSELMQKIIAMGISDYIAKPFQLDSLEKIIASRLQSRLNDEVGQVPTPNHI